MSVFSELKRRNVFRVAALYLVAAWVLLQIGDLLFGLLGLPAWSNKLLFAALVLGFVPALIFSWVYELTPEGLKREHEVERNASITAETARKLDLIVVALLVVAIVVVAVERFLPRTEPVPTATYAGSEASSADAPVQAAEKSIAVLPFADMSAGKDQELADLKEKEGDVAAYQIAEVHAFRGEDDLAFEWLQRAYDQRDSGVLSIKDDRLMRGLLGDPRYKAFLRKLKLPE